MKNIFKMFLIVFCVCSVSLVFRPLSAFATSNIVNNVNYSSFGLTSELFDNFCAMSNCLNDTNRTYFDCRLFSIGEGGYEETSGSSEEANRIRSDLRLGVLNLSHGESGYECIKDMPSISLLSSMSRMEFYGIKIVKIENNTLEVVDENSIVSFSDLEELYIRNNNLSRFELNDTYFGLLKTLDLSGNKLTKVNLNCMATNSDVDLSDNCIGEIDKLSFPEHALNSLNLSFNNLTDEMDMDSLTTVCSVKPYMAVQGLNKTRLLAGEAITVYNDDISTRLALDIRYDSRSSYSTQGSIVSTSGGEGFEKIYLPAGKLFLTFSYNSLPVGCDAKNLVDRSVNSYLPMPNYYTTFNGVCSQSTQYNGDFILTIDDTSPRTMPNKSTVDNDCTLNIFSGNKLDGNTFNITRNGTVSFNAYFTFDELDSESLFITVTKTDDKLITIAIIIIVGIAILSVSGVTLFNFFKNGGQVAPLNQKELRSIRRKENRYYGNEYDFDTPLSEEEEEKPQQDTDYLELDELDEDNFGDEEEDFDDE